MADQACKNCKFFQEHGKDGTGNLVGWCRRFPRNGLIYSEDEDPQWLFPVQFGTDWCGEYKKFGTTKIKPV